MVLSGYHIPKGTYVDLNPFVRFRDPSLFSDAEAHRPERWLRADGGVSEIEATTAASSAESETAKVHPYLLTPFGHGTRMCAGRR
jgi:cytochrome P450